MESQSKKLIRVRTSYLPNGLHFRFHTENNAIYLRYGDVPLGIDLFTPSFRERIADLETALERIVKSADTERIAVADHLFDTSFSGMAEYVHSYLNHFDPAVRRSAENLQVLFHHYGNIGRQPYRQELASSHNLMQDIREHAEDMAALSLTPWMTAHEQAAAALAALLNDRVGETAQQTELRVKKVRREVDAVYQQITNRIDAMINLRGPDFVPGFIAGYNAHATEYKNILAQHLGRIHSKKRK